jgi:hypothetical protein
MEHLNVVESLHPGTSALSRPAARHCADAGGAIDCRPCVQSG